MIVVDYTYRNVNQNTRSVGTSRVSSNGFIATFPSPRYPGVRNAYCGSHEYQI